MPRLGVAFFIMFSLTNFLFVTSINSKTIMKALAKTICIILLFTIQFACTSNEIGFSKDVNQETVYMDYNIFYNGGDSVTCFLQYRFAGENGTTLVLSEPSNVSIDGMAVSVDSSSFSGAYYKKNFAINNFNGDHQISFTDINGQTKNESFNFHLPELKDCDAFVCSKNEMVLAFANTKPADVFKITIADTSAKTNDLNIRSNLIENKIIISPQQLQQLATGNCKLTVLQSNESALKNPTPEGGRIITSYLIKEINIELYENVVSKK